MTWSMNKSLEFIQALRHEEAIWNPKCSDYRDRIANNEAWTRLQEQMDVPIKELKKKKDCVFITYRKYARKVADSRKICDASESIYKPSWFLFGPIDIFLREVYMPGAIKRMKIRDELEEETNENTSETFVFLNSDDTQNLVKMECESDTDTNNSDSTPTVSTDSKNTKRKLKETMKDRGSNEEVSDILRSHVGETHAKPKKDLLELYADLLLSKLRGMDEKSQDIAMHEIDNLMFRLKYPRIDQV